MNRHYFPIRLIADISPIFLKSFLVEINLNYSNLNSDRFSLEMTLLANYIGPILEKSTSVLNTSSTVKNI